MSLAAAPFFPGVPNQFLSPTSSHSQPLPRMSPFGGSDISSNPDAPLVPMLHRSPLPPSSLRSVSETEDEAEEEQEIEVEEKAVLPIFAPQATAPIQTGAFDGVTSATTDHQGVLPRDEQPDFAVGFGLDQDESDEEDVGHTSFGQQPADLAEFGGFSGVQDVNADDEGLDEIDPEIDDGVTEGAFITPSHSRQVSRALTAVLNQPPPPLRRHQPGLSTASVQSVMRIEDLHHAPAAPESVITEFETVDESIVRTQREMSVITDDYAGGDEKENIPPPALHGDLGFVWPGPDASEAHAVAERRASGEDWTNPSLHQNPDGEIWTNSENDEVSGDYVDAHSDNEVRPAQNSYLMFFSHLISSIECWRVVEPVRRGTGTGSSTAATSN